MKKKNSHLVIVFGALMLALIVRVFIISVYKIPTGSMTPTFMPGDFIISSKISYGLKFPWAEDTLFKSPPKTGDLVVFRFKAKPAISYIKRIKAVEGETITNLEGVQQVVPAGEVYVANDNAFLKDETSEGFALISDIDSQPKLIWFSYSKESGIRWDRLLRSP